MFYDTHVETESLYIHWPFCPYKCHFCPFVALAGADHHQNDYQKALHKEIEGFAQSQKTASPLKTIYIGGGTPSTWPNKLLLDTFGKLRDTFDFSSISEITIEANPGTVVPEQIEVWKSVGITRVSVGVQSLNDTVLENLNRKQSAQQVRTLINQLAGNMRSVSIDMIVGLPGISSAEWKECLQEVVTWPIEHISMYFLSVHEGTPLYFRVARKQLVLPPDEMTVDLYYWSVDCLAQAGFAQYEVSSFAKPGFESQHNQVYWDRKPFKGFGIGAWSFDGKARIQNEKNIEKYIKAQQEGKQVAFYQEEITQEAEKLERLMLGLRRVTGVLLKDALEGLSQEKQKVFFDRLAALQEKNLVIVKNQSVMLSPTSLALENEIAAHLSV